MFFWNRFPQKKVGKSFEGIEQKRLDSKIPINIKQKFDSLSV